MRRPSAGHAGKTAPVLRRGRLGWSTCGRKPRGGRGTGPRGGRGTGRCRSGSVSTTTTWAASDSSASAGQGWSPWAEPWSPDPEQPRPSAASPVPAADEGPSGGAPRHAAMEAAAGPGSVYRQPIRDLVAAWSAFPRRRKAGQEGGGPSNPFGGPVPKRTDAPRSLYLSGQPGYCTRWGVRRDPVRPPRPPAGGAAVPRARSRVDCLGAGGALVRWR